MTTSLLKDKVIKSIEELDAEHLKLAYKILKEFSGQQKYADTEVNKDLVERKINKGISELENNEGTDFGLFLSEMKAKYGNKK
ncbi:MAG: hypothetical protein ABI123_03885 [Ginsengibacter sp.]